MVKEAKLEKKLVMNVNRFLISIGFNLFFCWNYVLIAEQKIHIEQQKKN